MTQPSRRRTGILAAVAVTLGVLNGCAAVAVDTPPAAVEEPDPGYRLPSTTALQDRTPDIAAEEAGDGG